MFANQLAALDPAFMICVPTELDQLVEGRPVDGVVIFEFNITANRLHELRWWDVFAKVFIELELFSRDRVDEWGYHFEEAPDHERDCVQVRSAYGTAI